MFKNIIFFTSPNRDNQGHSVVDEVLYHDMYQLMPLYQEYVMGLIKNNDVDTVATLSTA